MAVDISTLTNETDFLTPYQIKKIVYDYKTNVKPPTYPSGVAANLSKGEVTEGEIVYATAEIVPSGYDSKRIRSITWEASSNVNINPQSGIITARSAGTAAVRCTVTYHPVSMDDNETRTVSGTTYLIVQPATVYADYVVATLDNYSVTQGDTLYARATVYPTNASNRSVTWRSSNPSIASIDSISGKITTYAAGSVYFIATAADGSGRTANTSNLQIAAKEVKVDNISVTVDPSTVTAGGTAQATATVYPNNADNKAVTWSISPTSGASINATSGAITTTAQGNYTVTATAQDGSGVIGSGVLAANAKSNATLANRSGFATTWPINNVEYCDDGYFYAIQQVKNSDTQYDYYICRSIDAINWSRVAQFTIPQIADGYLSYKGRFVYANGFYIIALRGKYIATSTNGTSWQLTTLPYYSNSTQYSETFRSADYCLGEYVVGGEHGQYVSSNTTSWTTSGSGYYPFVNFKNVWLGVNNIKEYVYKNGRYLENNQYNTFLAWPKWSPTSKTNLPYYTLLSERPHCFVKNKDMLAIITESYIGTLTDINAKEVNIYSQPSYKITNMAYGNNMWVGLFASGFSYHPRPDDSNVLNISKNDCASWSPTDILSRIDHSFIPHDITYGKNKWVIAGNNAKIYVVEDITA